MPKIKYQDRNLNKGTDLGREMVKKSIDKFGMRDAVILDNKGNIISGNHRHKSAKESGIKTERIIEASKDEIIAIQYNDIDLDTLEGKELALALNASAKANINIDTDMAWEELGDLVEDYGIMVDHGDINDDDDTKSSGSSGPRASDDGYSNFELIMLHDTKLKFVDLLAKIKEKYMFEKLEESILHLVTNFKL